MSNINYPHCSGQISGASSLTGQVVACPLCRHQFVMPPPIPPLTATAPRTLPPIKADVVLTKTCPYCADEVAAKAIKCKHCGSILTPGGNTTARRFHTPPTGIIAPVLVSAIGDIVVGLFWLFTCFGVVVAVPMFVLCIAEFKLYARAGRLRPAQIASQAITLGWFESVIEFFNVTSLICRIIVLINASNVHRDGRLHRHSRRSRPGRGQS